MIHVFLDISLQSGLVTSSAFDGSRGGINSKPSASL
jgi:hypothetical protein